MLTVSGIAATVFVPTTSVVAAETASTSSADADADVDADADADADVAAGDASIRRGASSDRPDDADGRPWIERWAPVRNEVELSAYGGAVVPSSTHELYDADPMLPDDGYQRFAPAAGALGGRVGYAPSRFFGIEGEGGAAPIQTANDNRATLWHARGSAVGQLGLWSVVPFVLVGGGVLGVSSARAAVGDDVDAAIHVGTGVKINTSRRFAVRLDFRDVIAAERGAATGVTHNGEILLGATLRLGKAPEPEPEPVKEPGDRDRDGFMDPEDACPDRPGVAPDGCPVLDSDRDGFMDPEDACPEQAGVEPDGCPVLDRDRDGFLDDVDACPAEPGVEPDGCPLRDRDADGFLDVDDSCPDEAEVRNGFEDTDGCPDEVPKEVEKFSGVIRGIYFEVDRAVIRPRSRSVLDRAVDVLARYPSVRVKITGHTDSTGSYDHNVELSARRAQSVRDYLVARGIAEERLSVRGAGPDEPVADNSIARGRKENRRIEFSIVEQ